MRTEGIERVVCGVTDVTTCRDVIIALARTIGRTGRYSLVESHYGHQRPLPASERLHARSLTSFYPNVTTLRSGLCYRKSVCRL